MIYTDIKLQLAGHLESNETLLWGGQPRQGIIFRSSDLFLIPFSLIWCGFVVFWLVTALGSGVPLIFALFGVPFLAIGLVFTVGRFFIDAKQRENTFYGITEDRIIIKSGVFTKSVKSLNIKTLSDIEVEEKSDGTGTISIGPRHPMTVWYGGMSWWPGMKGSPSLDYIDNVRAVYNQIISLQRKK